MFMLLWMFLQSNTTLDKSFTSRIQQSCSCIIEIHQMFRSEQTLVAPSHCQNNLNSISFPLNRGLQVAAKTLICTFLCVFLWDINPHNLWFFYINENKQSLNKVALYETPQTNFYFWSKISSVCLVWLKIPAKFIENTLMQNSFYSYVNHHILCTLN